MVKSPFSQAFNLRFESEKHYINRLSVCMCVILFFSLSDIELIYFLCGVSSELSVLLYESNKFRERTCEIVVSKRWPYRDATFSFILLGYNAENTARMGAFTRRFPAVHIS